MKESHHTAPLPADLDAIIAEGETDVEIVEIVETPETEFNNFNNFNATPSERIHPIPEDSIIADFRDIAREVSEAPDSFAVAPFLALIGGVLTPGCSWDFAGPKYCNLFQFVVGPPGIRKSTSFKLTERIGKDALSSDAFHSGNASDSAAFGKWKKQPHRIWLESEGNVTVQSWRGSHAGREIAARMLKLYDGDSWEQTYRHQEDKDGDGADQRIECATASLALGATPGVCRFDGVDGKTGLRRRFGYYTADRAARKINWPMEVQDDQLEPIIEAVGRIADLKGEFKLTPRARKLWDETQDRVRSEQDKLAGDLSEEAEIQKAQLAETPSRILKTAGIFQVCRWAKIGGDPFAVDEDTLKRAIDHQFACLEASAAMDRIAHSAAIDDLADKVLDTIRSEARDPSMSGRWEIKDEFIEVSKSDATRRFAANGSNRNLTAHHLHTHVMPRVIAKSNGQTVRTERKGIVYRVRMEGRP
jgi:hypothetical protein